MARNYFHCRLYHDIGPDGSEPWRLEFRWRRVGVCLSYTFLESSRKEGGILLGCDWQRYKNASYGAVGE